MTPEMQRFIADIYFETIPKQWKDHSYPSEKPLGSYIKDLGMRLKFIEKWIEEGAPPVFLISALYHPRKLLTGIDYGLILTDSFVYSNAAELCKEALCSNRYDRVHDRSYGGGL
jgi:hypothetical protein